MDILVWANGPIDRKVVGVCAYFHQHDFNVGQHVAHNEMLDECVRRGYDWHIRVDDDCWIKGRYWLRKLFAVQEEMKRITGRYCVLSPEILGLDNPPPTAHAYELDIGAGIIVEQVKILGGIFRMAPMGLMRYFRWDERQAMGFGDATQFSTYCESVAMPLLRVRSVTATHGDSTHEQKMRAPEWDHEHDMLQYIPLGL